MDAALSSAEAPPPGTISYDALYRTVAPFLTRVLRCMRVPERDMPDVAQDVRLMIFRKAIQALPPDHPMQRWVRGEPGAERCLQRWVGGVAYGIVRNYRAAAHRHREQFVSTGVVSAVSKEPSPMRQLAHAERLFDLIELLNGLPESRRTVLVMHYFESQTTEAISRQLAIPEGTVSTRLRLARADLKAAIERTARGELRHLLDLDDWDSPFEQPLAIATDPGDGSTAAESSKDDRRWAGLIASLLIVGLRRVVILLDNPTTSERRASSDGPPEGRSGGRAGWSKRHSLLLAAPIGMVTVFFGATCKSQANIAHGLPRVTLSVVASSVTPAQTLPRERTVQPVPTSTTQQGVPQEGQRERPSEPAALFDSDGSISPWGVPYDSATPVVERPTEMRPTSAMIPALFAACLNGTGCLQNPVGSGAGGAVICVPGETKPCYSGPPGTEGISHCKAGTVTCQSNGTAWGPCIGESAPVTEICSAPEDEDCDGNAPSCSGDVLWAHHFGGLQPDYFGSVASDADGNTWLAGGFKGAISFGGMTYMSTAGTQDMLLVKLDPNGDPLFVQGFGSMSENDFGRSIAVDAAGNVVVAGNFGGSIDLGGGPLTSTKLSAPFLASFDAKGGHRWSKAFPGNNYTVYQMTLAVEPAGSIIYALSVEGDIDLGGGPMITAYDAVQLVKYDASGKFLWGKQFASPYGPVRARSVAVNGDGTIALGGHCAEVCFFGGEIYQADGIDAFVATFNSNGDHLWSNRFGDMYLQIVTSVAVDPASHVFVTGHFEGNISFPGPITSVGGTDLVLAMFDVPIPGDKSGTILWTKVFGDADDQYSADDHALSVDHAGDILWTGRFSGTLDFGGTPLVASPPAGTIDSFIVKLDSSGNHLWSRKIATASPGGIAVAPSGDVAVAGSFYTPPIDFGSGPLISNGENDIYLAKLRP